MTLVRSFGNIFKTMLVVLVAGFFFLSPVAMASPVTTPSIPISNGSFSTSEPIDFPSAVTVESATVTLTPEDEAGIVNVTIQQGSQGKIYECTAYAVKTGEDLIQKCAEGPARIEANEPGLLTVSGSGFNPVKGVIKVTFDVN